MARNRRVDVRLVHVGLAGLDQRLDMTPVLRLGVERRAGIRPDLTAFGRVSTRFWDRTLEAVLHPPRFRNGTWTYGAFDDAAVVCFLELGPSFLGAVTAAAADDEVKDRDAGWATARRAVAVWRLRSMTGGAERI